jgi:translocation and assembly module TamA
VRGNFRYTDVNVDGKALQLAVDGRADTKIQELALRLVRPPNDRGYVDSFESKLYRSDIEGLTTLTASVGVTRRTLEQHDQTAWHAVFYVDDQRAGGEPVESSHALHLEYERTWRKVDSLVAPTRGFVVSSRVGGGPPGVSTRGYGRAVVQYASYHPLDAANTINLRAEAGAVLATARDGIPSALLFRTGGDTTVRGYAFESLGVKTGDATLGGRYYAIASAEAIHYFSPLWGLAAFVDAGNAGDDSSSLKPVLGYGAGLRIRSPIGPLRFDVAYGQETSEVRVHMSVGLSF